MHGYPSSSFMWRRPLEALAGAGWHAVAPDLPGYGDSEPDPPGTWERHIESLERFRTGLGLEDVLLVVHDWGGLIGLRWACDHPGAARALAISDTGFFPDGKWHGMAKSLRTEGEGEQFMDNVSRDLLAMGAQAGLAGHDRRRRGRVLEVPVHARAPRRRAGDVPLGRLREARALRGQARPRSAFPPGSSGPRATSSPRWPARTGWPPRSPGPRSSMIEGAGHFLVEDAPDRYCEELVAFATSLSA